MRGAVIDDSEDELTAVTPLRDKRHVNAHLNVMSTATQLKTAHHDLFDISSTFGPNVFSLTGDGSRKRRKTGHDNVLADKTDNYMTNSRLIRSQTAVPSPNTKTTLQHPLTTASDNTIRIATAEREQLVEQVLQENQEPLHQNISLGDALAHNSTNSSIPWSIEPSLTSITPPSHKSVSGKTSSDENTSTQTPIHQNQSSNNQSDHPHSRKDISTTKHRLSSVVDQSQCQIGRAKTVQIDFNNIDWSVAPEKANKKRKRRTNTEINDNNIDMTEILLEKANAARDEDSSATKNTLTGESNKGRTIIQEEIAVISTNTEHAFVQDKNDSSGPDEPVTTQLELEEVPDITMEDPVNDPVGNLVQEDTVIEDIHPPTPKPRSIIEVSIPRIEPPDFEFLEPMLPSPAPPAPSSTNSIKKSRRSHTTIFEDHVGMDERPDTELNLKQQQASRKKGRGRPKKQKVSIDEEVTEVESEIEQEVVVPTKRGRKKGKMAKPVETVDELQAAEVEQVGNEVEEAAEVETFEDSHKETPQLPVEPSQPKLSTPEDTNQHIATVKVIDQTIMTNQTDLTELTDVTEVESTKPTEKPMHSPIKTSTTAFRVGLNKKQRIRSLLKSVKR